MGLAVSFEKQRRQNMSIIFRNMKVVLVLFLLLITANADVERCQEVLAQFNRCTEEAHMTYAAAVNKGNDGRPDFHARKACNYAEDAIQGCGNQLPGECFTQEQVDEKKDAEIAQILKSLESQIPNWDTSKCPAVTLSAYKPRTETPRLRGFSSATSTFPSSILTLLAILIGTILKTL